MGRRSLAAERVEQILDAYGEALARHGVEGATVGRVSELSGLSRSHIRHYVGAAEEIPTLFQERLTARYIGYYEELAAGFPAGGKARGLVSRFFGPPEGVGADQRAIVAATSIAGSDGEVRQRVLAGYERLVACLAGAFAQDAPGRDRAECDEVAYRVFALLFGHWVLRGVGFPPQRQEGVLAEALRLVDAFTGGAR